MRSFCFLLVIITSSSIAAQSVFDSLYILRTDTVFFPFGSHEITPESDSLLEALAGYARKYPKAKIDVKAHTDAIGGQAENEALSQKRALATVEALLHHGVPDSSIFTSGFGERQPIRENTTDEGRRYNRRAVVSLGVMRTFVRVTGQITAADLEGGVPGYIWFQNDSIPTDDQGNFTVAAPLGTSLPLEAYAPNRFYATAQLDLTRGVPKTPFLIPLEPIGPGKIFTVNNLFFVGNQDVLLPKSVPELPKILRFLKANPHIRIEIAGHMNMPNHGPVPVNSWEYDLSVRRAKMVYRYLVDRGIAPFRLSYQGYGNWEMRYPKAASRAEQEQNRRVELRILD